MSNPRLITQTDIAAYSGLQFSQTEQSEIDRLCEVVSQSIMQETNRIWVENDGDIVTEIIGGNGRQSFWLRSRPVTNDDFQAVMMWDTSTQSWQTYTGDAYIVNNRLVLETEIDTLVKVTYKGKTASTDVKQALIEWVLLIWGAKFQGGKWTKRENTGATNQDYLTTEKYPNNIQNVIDNYRIYNV